LLPDQNPAACPPATPVRSPRICRVPQIRCRLYGSLAAHCWKQANSLHVRIEIGREPEMPTS
jgi:hypothetical protein